MSHDGTYVNTPTLGAAGLVTGDANTAVTFNPAGNEYVVQNDTIANQTFTALTIGVLVKPNDPTDANAPLLFGVYGATADFITLRINASGNVEFAGNSSAGASAFNVIGTTTLSAATRYRIIGTWDGTTAKLYVNGALDGSQAFADPVDLVDNDNFYAGTDQFGTTGNVSFDGTLDEPFFVANHAATTGEIGTIDDAWTGTGSAADAVRALSPYIFWRLGEASGTTAADSAGGLDPPPAAPDSCIIDVVDIDGTVITNLPLAWCESITRTKNQPDEAVIKFPKYAYTRDDVHVFADDSGSGDLHEIRVMRSGTVRFWGPAVSADTNSSDGTVTLHCKGVDWYLTRRYINGQRTNLLTNGSFETGDETGWTATGGMTHAVTTDDAVDGTHSLRLESITPLGDIFEYQNVSVTGTGVGTFITVTAYFKIEGALGGHALDRRGLYVEGLVGSDVQTNNFYAIDEATPAGEFIRAKTNIQVPTLTTWDLNIRTYSPPGSILWDKLKVVAMQSVSTAGLTGDTTTPVDVAEIVELIHNFVQDPTFGHSDVNIGLDNPTVGVKQVEHIQWAENVSWSAKMSEWLDRDDCFDYSVVYTETTRILTLHVPQQGVDRRGDFTLTFPGNVASMSVTEDGGGTITDDTELDQDSGDGPDREEGHYADATQVGGVTLQAVNTAPEGAAISALDPIAREQVNKARRPALLYTFLLTNQDGTEYDELLGLGDLVDFDVTNGWASSSGYGAIAQLVEYPRNRRAEVTLAKAM